jgi:hypothetical protein
MKINIRHIIEGVVNTVQAKEEIEKIASSRRSICDACEFKGTKVHEHCKICGCNLTLKTHSLHSSCPINKWLAVATEQESEEIENKLESDE